ncbi:MAG: AMIN domain-containing protein [Desulfobulbaceae bacterium]|nr:AMIN domain-containing protein [Desulfobulbaceae bacterium]
MLKWLAKLQPAVLFAFCLLLVLETPPARSEPGVTYEITDIKVDVADNTLTYNISGTSPPVYTVSERFSPFRVIVDVAGAFFSKDLPAAKAKIPENRFSELVVSDLKGQDPQVMRFEFTLADSHDYSIAAKDNNLQIKLNPASTKNAPTSASESKGNGLSLKDFKVTSTPNTTTISIIANTAVDKYTVDTVAGAADHPPRMYIDISNVKTNELVKEKQIGTSVAKARVAPKGKGVRIVFDSASSHLFKYTVTPAPTGLNVVIDETPGGTQSPSQKKGQGAEKPAGADTTLDALIGSSQQLLSSGSEKLTSKSTSAKVAALENDFSFSGYNKQRISVDFYKIDIHNVFRLFRQITDLNIIVDEEVQGALTLALNDVPWDFALDIILNLMDLKKEERFNTIVIYPSKKAFVWPTRVEDNLAVQADVQVIEQEALVIEKSASQSKEIVAAKGFIVQAQKLEEQNSYEEAAALYVKAAELWPDNAAISNRLATIYLVNLGINAKAVFYAKQSLKHDPSNTQAALYAAIGSANMQQIAEASEYFAQSISSTPPMKEALFSYAAFSENNGKNDAALKILQKFESHYGQTLDTMVSKARILDKQGLTKEATQEYMAVLASGFQLPTDLKRYIEGRLAAKDLH